MTFTETALRGAFVIDLTPYHDARGFFARTFCQHEFERHGLNPMVAQCNLSFNLRAGTIRGMHFQKAPAREAKLIRCVRGAIYDVIIDLRLESATYAQYITVPLDSASRRALYVPESFAHGFQTLVGDTEVEYQMSEFYTPDSSAGFRFDDPALSIHWPQEVSVISEQDLSWPAFVR